MYRRNCFSSAPKVYPTHYSKFSSRRDSESARGIPQGLFRNSEHPSEMRVFFLLGYSILLIMCGIWKNKIRLLWKNNKFLKQTNISCGLKSVGQKSPFKFPAGSVWQFNETCSCGVISSSGLKLSTLIVYKRIWDNFKRPCKINRIQVTKKIFKL